MMRQGVFSRRAVLQAGIVALSAVCLPNSPVNAIDATEEAGLRAIPGTEWSYHLIPFDENGRERTWHGQLVSEQVQERLKSRPVTDVFIFSHGWRGDVSDAVDQYDAWVSAMAGCTADLAAVKQARPDFSPLLIGVHWPSLPFGDEELRAYQAAAIGPGRRRNDDERVDFFAHRIADSRRARSALHTILNAADQPPTEVLSRDVARAFLDLQTEAGLLAKRSSAPGADCEPFDPVQLYSQIRSDRSGGGDGGFQGADDLNGFLQMLGYLSFWKMKDRARMFGETGAHELLQSLQRLTVGRDVRFHLMGHSFGCIVVSACVAGPPGARTKPLPVDSLTLIQGALSLWAYCSNVEQGIADSAQPSRGGTPGYFRPLIERRLVKGPIVTTQSTFDSAVGELYPWAAWWRGQVVMASNQEPKPKYGAIGAHGICGPGCETTEVEIQNARYDYGFQPGKIYNLDCSRIICNGSGASGAHSDICHPEVAHLVWQAASVVLEPTPAPLPPPKPVDPPDRPLRRIIRRLIPGKS